MVVYKFVLCKLKQYKQFSFIVKQLKSMSETLKGNEAVSAKPVEVAVETCEKATGEVNNCQTSSTANPW